MRTTPGMRCVLRLRNFPVKTPFSIVRGGGRAAPICQHFALVCDVRRNMATELFHTWLRPGHQRQYVLLRRRSMRAASVCQSPESVSRRREEESILATIYTWLLASRNLQGLLSEIESKLSWEQQTFQKMHHVVMHHDPTVRPLSAFMRGFSHLLLGTWSRRRWPAKNPSKVTRNKSKQLLGLEGFSKFCMRKVKCGLMRAEEKGWAHIFTK